MRFRDAKKLHNEDEVTVKEIKGERPLRCLRVVSIEVDDKDVFVRCEDGKVYHHTAIM